MCEIPLQGRPRDNSRIRSFSLGWSLLCRHPLNLEQKGIKRRVKVWLKNKMSQSKPLKAPLIEFTKLMTLLDCGAVETYHHFKVPKKGKAKKPIIFLTLGDMESHAKSQRDDGTRTSYEAPDELFQPKNRSMCLRAECDPRRLKNCVKVSLSWQC